MNKKTLTQLTLLTLTALALIGVIAACAPPQLPAETPAPDSAQGATAMPALEGPIWQLESYADADGNTQPALADAPATIIFKDGKFIGDTHCNGVGGEYTLDGDKITTQMGPSTLRACEPDIASQEGGMAYGVSHAASYKIEDGKLMLLDADGNVLLTFVEQPPAELGGNAWQLISFNNGNGMESNQTTARIVVTFGEDGKVSGNAGCNNFNGAYEVDGEEITIGPLATTRKMCAQPEGVMETEQAFLQAMGNAATFSIMGDRLTIYDKDGAKLLIFTLTEPLSLTSTPWRLQSFNNGKGGMATTVAAEKITAAFTDDGKVAGNAGCNKYSGGYQVDGDAITIGPLASTQMLCNDPADVMETEAAFLQNMSNAATFAIENDMLTLFDKEGKKLLIFNAAAAQ